MSDNKKKLTTNLNVFWTKAEKELCKRTKSINSMVKVNSSETALNTISYNYPAATTNGYNSKVSFKDLCDEDKARIANLVKEIAKLGAEKEDVTKQLEEERGRFDSKLTEITKQQGALVEEKELLLQKLVETQEKLSKLNEKRMENIDLIRKRTKTSKQQKPKIPSSTPHSTPPRSISPIINLNKREFTKKIDNEIVKLKGLGIGSGDEQDNLLASNIPILHSTLISKDSNSQKFDLHDIKRQQLFKQHIELIDEQKQLKNLLEQQELMLKEKHNQIMLQQQMHRERLNQLSSDPRSTIEGAIESSVQQFNGPIGSVLAPSEPVQSERCYAQRNNAATSPIRVQQAQRQVYEAQRPQVTIGNVHIPISPLQTAPTSIHFANQKQNRFIDKYDSNASLLSIDFNQVPSTASTIPHAHAYSGPCSGRASLNTTKQENNFLIDLIFENNNNKNNNDNRPAPVTVPLARLNNRNSNINVFNNKQAYCNSYSPTSHQDEDDSKLIEEIFFLN